MTLAIQFKIKARAENGVLATTDSGYEFTLTDAALIDKDKNEFKISDIETGIIRDEERPHLARAIINEIVGMNTEKTEHDQTKQERIG
jgi:hypothetical protein